jgi:hypothetical protein
VWPVISHLVDVELRSKLWAGRDSRIGKVRNATKKHMADPARHARKPRNLAKPTTRTTSQSGSRNPGCLPTDV